MVQDIVNVNGVKTFVSEVKFQKKKKKNDRESLMEKLLEQACTT